MSAYSEACDYLLEPLQVLFNSINSSGDIPDNFKTARVILIYKKKWPITGQSACQITSPRFGKESSTLA